MPLGRRISPHDPEISWPEPASGSAAGAAGEDNPHPYRVEEPQYEFADIILNAGTYDAIQDTLTLYDKADLLFETWGLKDTQKHRKRVGINLYGASGTGKSMTAHAIAHQLQRPILTVDYAQIESKYVGETSKNLTGMFQHAEATGAVLFFDEADALLSRRVTDMSSATDVSVNQTRSVLLVLVSNYDGLILFATNFVTNYDPAFMRRISAHVKFELPDEENRRLLWAKHIPRSMPNDADVAKLAGAFTGVSGSDISNAVFTAALRAARLDEKRVPHAYFEDAIQRIVDAKQANSALEGTVTRRTVSEEYVREQLGGDI